MNLSSASDAASLELPAEPAVVAPAGRTASLRKALRMMASALDWVFGLICIILGLALLSVAPVLNFLSLGYLLHASGQVASTGKLRNGFIGIRKASLLGSLLIGSFVVFIPVRLVSDLWKDAELVAPGSARAQWWHFAVVALAGLMVLHVVWACLRGGRFRHFLWPAPLRFVRWLRTPDKFQTIRNSVADYIASLRLPYYFWLGARGFFGAFLWLALPVGLLIAASALPPDGGALLSLAGGLGLMFVALYLPFLETHFAVTGRFRDLFARGEVKALFQRAPLAFWTALFFTLLFALPLYLLKIELPPREIAWLPSLLFVVFIFPARLLTGWAVGRARKRETPRHRPVQWLARVGMIPVVFFYALFVYLTQFLSWNGALSLLEQHAFMVPAPLMNF